jgi:hypothetical protein
MLTHDPFISKHLLEQEQLLPFQKLRNVCIKRRVQSLLVLLKHLSHEPAIAKLGSPPS